MDGGLKKQPIEIKKKHRKFFRYFMILYVRLPVKKSKNQSDDDETELKPPSN